MKKIQDKVTQSKNTDSKNNNFLLPEKAKSNLKNSYVWLHFKQYKEAKKQQG